MPEQNMSRVRKKRTPEEVKKAQDEGNAFIQQREKLTNQLGGGRLASEQASRAIASNDPREIARKHLEQEKVTADERAIEDSIIQAQRRKELEGLSLGTLTPEQQALEVVQGEGAVGKAAVGGGAITGAVGGAGIGAAIGTAALPGVGTAIGAGIGAGAGFIGGALTKISLSRRQDVKSAFSVFQGTKSNMAWIINNVNAGKISPMQAADMWDDELANFYSAQRNLKKQTSSDLDRFLSGGSDEAAKLEAFNRRLPELQQQLLIAMQAPNPNSIINLDDPSSE